VAMTFHHPRHQRHAVGVDDIVAALRGGDIVAMHARDPIATDFDGAGIKLTGVGVPDLRVPDENGGHDVNPPFNFLIIF
jgi:hypothetical protein